jgi:DHA1 family bicyclomycin/chloramphenicol resistance-like MFS transporter
MVVASDVPVPKPSAERPGLRRPAALLVAGLSALAPVATDMYLPGLPAIGADLHASPGAVTASVSVFFAGLAVGQLFSGPWSDRVGRRIPVLIGLCLFATGSVVAASAPVISVLLLGRLLQAAGSSAVMVTARAVVRDVYDERGAARFFSSMTLVSGLAPVLAPGIGAGLLLIASWRVIFLVMAGYALLLLGASLGLAESRSAETARLARESHPLRTYATLLSKRRFVGFVLAAGCNGGCYFTFLAAAPIALMQSYGLTSVQFSLIVGFNSVGLIGAAQFNRLLLRSRVPQGVLRGSARNALILATIFAGFGLTLYGGLPVLLALAFAVISSTSIIQANTLAAALSIVPGRAGAAAAVVGAGSFSVGTAMSLLAGLLYNGTPSALIGVMALALVGTAAALLGLALPHRGEV